ncbi:MAG: hypothetical protein ABI717_02165 [Actinomycetota bacterium]
MLEQNPLLALAAAASCVGVPVAAVLAGIRLDARYAELARDDAVLRSLALGIGATGLVGGAAIALLAPGLAQLGGALEAAPISRAAAAWSLTVAPACAGGAVLLAPLLLFATTMAGVDGFVLAAAIATAVVSGAALGEGLRQCGRLEPPGLAVLGAAAGLWAIGGAALGAGWYLGPAGAVAGARPPLLSLTLLAAFTLGGLTLWVAACAMQSTTRLHRRDVRATSLPGQALPAVAVAIARRVVRHRELRAQAAAAVLLPVALAAVLGATLDVGGGPLLAFAVGLSITAAALLPAAAVGLGGDDRWLFDAAPRPARVVAGAVALGGVGASLEVVAAAALLAAPFARGDSQAYLELEGAAAFVLGCAAFGGAVVPWRADRLLQQLASYGSVIAVVVCGWLAVGRLEGAAGLDGTAFTLVAGNLVLALGVAAAGAIAG